MASELNQAPGGRANSIYIPAVREGSCAHRKNKEAMSESQQPGFPILKPGKRPSMRRCISEQTSKTSKTKPKRGAKVRFIGKYQLGETFGRGKFSTVAEGTCIHTNQTFALKIMKQ
eukprot:594726-Amorphochlora_amoeboformis.AAC.1